MIDANGFNTFGVGTLAYLNMPKTGLIPCKVLDVLKPREETQGVLMLRIKVTATRGAYKAGEVLEQMAYYVYPRKCVCKSRNGYKYVCGFKWSIV